LVEFKRISLVKPSVHTPYHIDFNWWSQNDRDWRVYLHSFLCPEHRETYSNVDLDDQVDWIDPDTAEVHQIDGLQNVLITHCAKQPSFITHQSTLVDSVFRLFLANGNTPLTAVELGEQLGRDSNLILKTLSGIRVYKGLRPCL